MGVRRGALFSILPLLAFLVPVVLDRVLGSVQLAPDPSPLLAMFCNEIHDMTALIRPDLVPSPWCHVVNVPFPALLGRASAAQRFTAGGDEAPFETFVLVLCGGVHVGSDGMSLEMLDGPAKDLVLHLSPWPISMLLCRLVCGRGGGLAQWATLQWRREVECHDDGGSGLAV